MDLSTVSEPELNPQSLTKRAASALRFSIRELLLLTTSVAALIALFLTHYQPSRPFKESALSTDFGREQHIRAAAKPLATQIALLHGGSGGSDDVRARNKEYSYRVELPPLMRGRFMDQLRRDADQLLRKDKCQLTGSETRGKGDELKSFRYWYEGDSLQGFLTVQRLDLSDDEVCLIILLHEHEDRR